MEITDIDVEAEDAIWRRPYFGFISVKWEEEEANDIYSLCVSVHMKQRDG